MELGADEYLVPANLLEKAADLALAVPVAIGSGGIDVVHSALDDLTEERPIGQRTAPEADLRDG
jgi:hypothetical protein